MTKIRKSRTTSHGTRSKSGGNGSGSMLRESIKNRYVKSKMNIDVRSNENFVAECRIKISEFETIVNTRLKKFDLSNTELVNYLNIINHYKVQIFIAENSSHELTKKYLQTGYKIQEINGILHTLTGRYNDEYNDILIEINNPKPKEEPKPKEDLIMVDKFSLDQDLEDLLDIDIPDELDSLIIDSSTKINFDENLDKMKILVGCDYLK